MQMAEPLFLAPVFHEKIWGGTGLRDEFGYDIPSDHTGEAWAISAHPHGPASIKNGPYKGMKLNELWDQHRELFGNAKGDVFPLLTKILDANQDLSVQVHPDNEYARIHEGELGKTESWYVIKAKPGAKLYYGHNAQTREEFAEMVKNGEWKKLLRTVPVHEGDFFYVPHGMVHAVGSGIMVLETQQSSDTTYRMYDFDRVDKKTGKLRQLHLQQSIDTAQVPFEMPKLNHEEWDVGDVHVTQFVMAEYFGVFKLDVRGKGDFEIKDGKYRLLSVLDGSCDLTVDGQTYPLKKGDHLILPSTISCYTLDGQATIIASKPGDEA